MSYYAVTYSNSLSHHGIKGQKWGRRRFQNQDGSLTPEGHKRYGVGDRVRSFGSKIREKASAPRKSMTDEQKAKLKKGLMIAAGVAVAGAAAYAGAKYVKNNKALETLMKDANYDIDFGRRMTERMSKLQNESSDNPTLHKSVTYLGNDLKQHTATYDKNLFGKGGRYENSGVYTQKTFNNLKEYKNARKAAGLSNNVIGNKYKKAKVEEAYNKAMEMRTDARFNAARNQRAQASKEIQKVYKDLRNPNLSNEQKEQAIRKGVDAAHRYGRSSYSSRASSEIINELDKARRSKTVSPGDEATMRYILDKNDFADAYDLLYRKPKK